MGTWTLLGRLQSNCLSWNQKIRVDMLYWQIYAASGKWGGAKRIRNVMKERCLEKEPACSRIELRNARHEFVAKDKFHPQVEEICEVNSKLVLHSKDAGYQPYTDYPFFLDYDDDFYFS